MEEIEATPAPRALEFADKTVVYLALKIEAEVLTGDGPLRKFCTAQGLSVRGILWLLDTFLQEGLISRTAALDKLKQLMSFNDRLPKTDCLERLKAWE